MELDLKLRAQVFIRDSCMTFANIGGHMCNHALMYAEPGRDRATIGRTG